MLVHLYVVSLAIIVGSSRILIQGNLIWRHGDRTPSYTYPNDPHKNLWTAGPYQLTDQGKSQVYDLGLYLKKKYGQILSKTYRNDEIYIKSTDLDRSKMSAQCIAAALYSPDNASEWNGVNTPWIPFPVHTTELARDWFANMYQDPTIGCPNFHKRLADVQAHEIKSINDEYQKVFNFLTQKTGVHHDFNFNNYFLMHDNLLCLKANNHTLPSWVDENLMDTLQTLSAMYVAARFTDLGMVHTKSMSKMRTGVILEKIVDNMSKRIRRENSYSIVGYSGHDWSIASLLISMGAYNWVVPPYASCIMLDLYRENDGTYSVEFWYRNTSASKPIPLSFYGCGSRCSYDKFLLVSSSVATDANTYRLCKSSWFLNDLVFYLVFALISLVFVFSIANQYFYDDAIFVT